MTVRDIGSRLGDGVLVAVAEVPVVRVLLILREHRLLADVLAHHLHDEPRLLFAGRADGTEDHAAAIVRTRADAVVTTDPEVARSVLARFPLIAVVVLAAGDRHCEPVTVTRPGVTAWIPRSCGVDELLHVLRELPARDDR
ncbi:hypothetical protein LQ327_20785 [Actinomycetospora endophytica]|uniref:Response regulatory domain-containing protein n=1 Tax=Actinomycetospora endophytica TaxID=2291215 RepID=A0ABS8PC22_9PSEU|nr:hypothetical protein [Actinomycetospora endophytica]MCD2195812.1 hypothetical protein [Actinomycetospora endophytica]